MPRLIVTDAMRDKWWNLHIVNSLGPKIISKRFGVTPECVSSYLSERRQREGINRPPIDKGSIDTRHTRLTSKFSSLASAMEAQANQYKDTKRKKDEPK